MGIFKKIKEFLSTESPAREKVVLLIFLGLAIWFLYHSYDTGVCKEEQYERTKGIYKRFSVDGNGNSGMYFEFVGEDGKTYEGFSLESAPYPVTVGDTLIIEYCVDTKNISEVDFADEYMQKYYVEKEGWFYWN
jgi:hypothetical protein